MTTRSIASYERQLRAAQREADIDRIAALERSLVSVHRQSFPKAERKVLPAPEPVDAEPLRSSLEAEAGIPGLIEQLGSEDSRPIALPPALVDRYELMREFRKRRRQGIPFWRIRDHVEAAREADGEAEEAADAQAEERKAAQEAEQRRLDDLWSELQQARASVAEELPGRIAAERERREVARAAEQQELDHVWARLQANDPEVTLPALKKAFADNEAPAEAIRCDGGRTTVVMRFPPPEAIVPERKPARTPTGKRTLKKRTKTEINSLYLEALGSSVLATVKEAFAVAPGTELVRLLVVRRETDKKNVGQLVPIYVGEFNRGGYESASPSAPGRALSLAPESMLNLKGKTEQVAPLDLSERPEVAALLV
ncbi:MAG TPA: hypothetical protein VFJ76_08485 [Solirubrobacterales bacterium]|nr:hypothetical protein [Solirubrobacterales bacterium]